jgi:hypothetical protein
LSTTTAEAPLELQQAAHRRLPGAATAWLVWTVGLSLFFAAMAARDLGNFRPVSSDEAEIMAVSYKLATEGVLGSDPQAGFFHAEAHHFLTLPVQHVLQALSFHMLGAGVAQARGVALAGAVSLIWIVGWLGWRWYGLPVAMLGELLLVGWPSNLVPGFPGLPLLTVARTARYDVTAVAFLWLSVALLEATLRRPTRLRALSTGLSAGLAALSQFFGAFALPLVALVWVGQAGRRAWTGPTGYWMLVGAGLPLLAYAMYALHSFADLVGQWSVYADRGVFGGPAFYLDNLMREPARYAHLQGLPLPGVRHADLLNRSLSPWLQILSTPGVLAWLGVRAWFRAGPGDRLLLAGLLVPQGLLALLDVTKAPLYAILLAPPLCLSLAAFQCDVLGWVLSRVRARMTRVLVLGPALGLLVIVAVEGATAYQADATRATQTTSYLDLGERIERSLPTGARVLGPERWWWPLHDHPYLALRNLWRQWQVAAASADQTPQFRDWVEADGADFLVLNDDVRQDITTFPDDLQDQFWGLLDACGLPWADWKDPTYGEIEVRHLVRPCPAAVVS